MKIGLNFTNKLLTSFFLLSTSLQVALAEDPGEAKLETLKKEYADKVAEFERKYGPASGLNDVKFEYMNLNLERSYEDSLRRAVENGEETEDIAYQRYKGYSKDIAQIREIESRLQQMRTQIKEEVEDPKKNDNYYGFILFGVGMTIILLLTAIDYLIKHQREVEKETQEKENLDRAKNIEKTVMSTVKKIESEPRSLNITMGNIDTNGGPVIVGSDILIKDSFNAIREIDGELARAIEELGNHIADSRNQAAIDLFQEFQKKIAEKNGNKTIIRNVWEGILKVLPAISELKTIVMAIERFF